MLKSLLNAVGKGPVDKVSKVLTTVFVTRDKGLEVHTGYYLSLEYLQKRLLKLDTL